MADVWTDSDPSSNRGAIRIRRLPFGRPSYGRQRIQGKIRHTGVSNFSEEQLREAERVTPVVSVQNRYNVVDRSSESMVDLCDQEMLTFLPWAPSPPRAWS
jgi:hypothetical protein